MLVIGNKKYRNLQEQVGWNTEQIDKIFEFLDGINVSDNVVVVLDITTPLTTEELEIVNREVAFIVYNGELYFKRNQDASYIYFDIIFQVISGTIITLTSSEITVTKSNGALGITNSTDYIYSKTQIDSLLSAKADSSYVSAQLALKANLAGADFTGSITAPSIIENMTGYSFSLMSPADLTENITYAGVVKNGNKITFAISGTINITNVANVSENLAYFTIPTSIANKLYPVSITGLGAVLDEKRVSFIDIANNSIIDKNVYLFKNNYGSLFVSLLGTGSMTAGHDYFFRYEVTFLLSDNLAS